ncbi:MAG: hypothetical protein GY847_33415 [Proteobacteria bacterium]|nr:hypothetical protein [Pseudomonadota bacterium]
MKNPLRLMWPKRRRYPIQIDDEGKSIRQRCFEAFDRRIRPSQVIRQYGFLPNTVYTYWRQWKKLPKGWHEKYWWARIIKKANPNFMSQAAVQAGKKLGMTSIECLQALHKPWATKALISGDWSRYQNDVANQEATTILKDIMNIILVGRVLAQHPRTIVQNLEADGIDFTGKRTGNSEQYPSEEPEDIAPLD